MDAAYVDADGLPAYTSGPLYLDEGGMTGWVLSGPPGRLGRFTAGPDACSVALVDSPFAFTLRGDTPRDADGRLHVVDSPAPGLIGIYTSAGAFVASYFGQITPKRSEGARRHAVRWWRLCPGSSSAGYSVTYANRDGAANALLPAIKGLAPTRIAAGEHGSRVPRGSEQHDARTPAPSDRPARPRAAVNLGGAPTNRARVRRAVQPA